MRQKSDQKLSNFYIKFEFREPIAEIQIQISPPYIWLVSVCKVPRVYVCGVCVRVCYTQSELILRF